MDKRNTGIIATIVTGLLCGCPGLIFLCLGAMYAAISQVPGAQIDMFGSNNPADALTGGIIAVLVGLVFVAIPVVVGILMLRKKKEPTVSNEPVPPPI